MSAQQQVGSDRKYKGLSYPEWILSLKPGDPVRVRYPWDDKDVPGGRVDKGEVIETSDGANGGWVLRVRYFNTKMRQEQTTLFYKRGGGSARILEHPEIDAAYNPDNRMDQGYEFLTRQECDKIEANRLMAGAI